jgi:hypothetical protein
MTNKQIATYALISLVVFIIAFLSDGEYSGGFTQFAYYAGLIGFYVFTVWGWVRLFKSDK